MTGRNTYQTSPFVCDMSAIEPDQRGPHIATLHEIFQSVQAIRELPEGYAFRLPNEPDLLRKVVEFILKERLCCPFFGFTVKLEPEGGPLWLCLTGREGVKPFIKAEIGEALKERIP